MAKQVRIITRVVAYDASNQKILLVRNRRQNYWYPPGGGWEQDKENIVECAVREVKEETGLEIDRVKFLYLQEFHDSPNSISFETVWLAQPKTDSNINELHIDQDPDGQVEEARWFSREELKNVIVYPTRLQNTFWDNISRFLENEDSFIGVVE